MSISQVQVSGTNHDIVAGGITYCTCATAAATTAKVATVASGVFNLFTGARVVVKFTYAVPASATLNVGSKGAKSIYHQGAAITAGLIEAGDIATFMYDGTQFHLLTVDRCINSVASDDEITEMLAEYFG